MRMRDFIRIVEGEVIPFAPKTSKEPEWQDHGDGFLTKRLSALDLFGNDPPHTAEKIALGRSLANAPAVEVHWHLWARSFVLPELNRMLKLRSGEGFEAEDHDRPQRDGFPPHRWAVQRTATNFILKFTHCSHERDDNGGETKVTRFGAIEYDLPVHDLAAAFQRLKAAASR